MRRSSNNNQDASPGKSDQACREEIFTEPIDPSESRNLDTRLVRTFVVVAEEMGFTAAARRLGMTQQGVSAHVRRLESMLATPLFERSRSHVALTEQGRALLHNAHAIVMATDSLFASARLENAPIRVAEIRGRRMMQDCWSTFRSTHPEQRVIFFDMLSREQSKAILDGSLDVGMGRLRRPMSGLSSVPLRLDPVMTMNVTPTPPLALRRDRLGYTGGSSERFRSWASYCQDLGRSVGADLLAVPHDNTMLEAIGQGQMTGDIPPVLAMDGMRDYPSADYFHFGFLSDIQPYYPWRLIWRTNESRREVRDFLSTALAVARAKNWLSLLRRDVEMWVPEDGTDHVAAGRLDT